MATLGSAMLLQVYHLQQMGCAVTHNDIKDLRKATKLSFAQEQNKPMDYLVAMQRHFWLTLAYFLCRECVPFLDALLTCSQGPDREGQGGTEQGMDPTAQVQVPINWTAAWTETSTLDSVLIRPSSKPTKGAVSFMPPADVSRGFYSRYFVVPKRDEGMRPIFDLRCLNGHLKRIPFSILTLIVFNYI